MPNFVLDRFARRQILGAGRFTYFLPSANLNYFDLYLILSSKIRNLKKRKVYKEKDFV